MMHRLLLSTFIAIMLSCTCTRADLRIPAATAYLDPDAGETRVSAEQGVTRWSDPNVVVRWFGELKQTGNLQVSVVLRVAEDKSSRLRLTIADQSKALYGNQWIRTADGEWIETSGRSPAGLDLPIRVKE